MENISKNDISFRLENLKIRVKKINEIIKKNNDELKNKYNFAKNIGISIDIEKELNNDVADELNKYIIKVDQILLQLKDNSEKNIDDEYKLLNNILYLDDIKLKNINELVCENRDLKVREYINKIAQRANQLIRDEETKYLDSKIKELSKNINFFDKITGRAKNKKVLIENYNLKKVETLNKKYIPENKSILEIVNITKNCGYVSDKIDEFINKLSVEYELGDLINNSLAVIDTNTKIPFFFNKDFYNKINSENVVMLDRINEKKKNKIAITDNILNLILTFLFKNNKTIKTSDINPGYTFGSGNISLAKTVLETPVI